MAKALKMPFKHSDTNIGIIILSTHDYVVQLFVVYFTESSYRNIETLKINS